TGRGRRRARAVVPVRTTGLFRRRPPRPSQRRAGVQPQRVAARHLGDEGLSPMRLRTALVALCLAICASACAPQAVSPPEPPVATPAPAADAAPGAVDASCRVASDCAVKN